MITELPINITNLIKLYENCIGDAKNYSLLEFIHQIYLRKYYGEVTLISIDNKILGLGGYIVDSNLRAYVYLVFSKNFILHIKSIVSYIDMYLTKGQVGEYITYIEKDKIKNIKFAKLLKFKEQLSENNEFVKLVRENGSIL